MKDISISIGYFANLITDMTLNGATDEEIGWVVRLTMRMDHGLVLVSDKEDIRLVSLNAKYGIVKR